MHRRQFLSALSATALSSVAVGAASATRSAEHEVVREDVTVESWDGTPIATTVFEPADGGDYPAVLATHGWGGSRDQRYGDCAEYARNGYVGLAYDSRGFGASGGEVGVDGPKEVRDVSALVDYLVAERKARPEVGMTGGSYAGGIQLNAAAEDDRIRAIVPEHAWHDLNYSLQPNGVVKFLWGTGLFAVGAAGSRRHEFATGDARGLQRGMDPRVHRSYAEGLAFNDFSEQSEAFYALRSPRYRLDDIDAAALFVQGWTDHLFVPNEAVWNFRGLRSRGVDTRLLLHNQGHGQIPPDASYPQATEIAGDAALAWLDAHLKTGSERDAAEARLDDLLPEAVTFYDTQAARFRSVPSFPEADTSVALEDAAGTGSGRSVVANTVAPTSNSYAVSQSFDAPASSVSFDFPARTLGSGDAPVELLGAPRLDLRVRPLGRETFLFVKPFHVTPNGAHHVADQVTPVRISVPASQVGRPRDVSLELLAFQRRLARGHALRVTVASTDAAFTTARESAGAAIDHDSTLHVPVR